MSYPRLAPDILTSGYLAFPTTASSGILTVADSTGALAQWELSATTPAPVTGTIGEPVRGEVGLPAFTVTLERTANTDSIPELRGFLADSGANYLVANLTVTSVGEPFSDFVRPEEFIFAPSDGSAVHAAELGAVRDDAIFIAVGHGESSPCGSPSLRRPARARWRCGTPPVGP